MQFLNLPNPGYLRAQLDQDLVKELTDQLACWHELEPLGGWTTSSADRRRWPASKGLKHWVLAQAQQYLARWPMTSNDLRWGSCWANRLSQGQRTPRHTHDSSLSWVIWVNCELSQFQLHWTSTTGWPQTLVLTPRPWEFALWPSRLAHEVPENTALAARLSISGNLH